MRINSRPGQARANRLQRGVGRERQTVSAELRAVDQMVRRRMGKGGESQA
jgi:hypothetical protein